MKRPIIKDLEIEETSAPMILVLGEAGAGKSHFINTLVGRPVVKESNGLHACTTKPQLVEVTVDGNRFLMVDTPGFNDTRKDSHRSDAEILREIARTLILQTELGVPLRGILMLFSITSARMTGDALRQLGMIKHICGKSNYENMMLVTTRWPERREDWEKAGCFVSETELREEFWRDLIRGGSKMRRFDVNAAAKPIVRSLASLPNITLALQTEMAGGVQLRETTAGAFARDSRREAEEMLKTKARQLKSDPGNHGVRVEVEDLTERVDSHKSAEAKWNDDMVTQIRDEIKTMHEEAQRKSKRSTVADIIKWLIGITELTVEIIHDFFDTS